MSKKRGPAVPVYTPSAEDKQQVMFMVGYGLTADQIGLLVKHPGTGGPIGEARVRALFGHELKAGKALIDAKVAESLWKKATGNGSQAVTAAIFWAKARMGWSERGEQDPGNPNTSGVLVVPAIVSQDEWIAMQKAKNDAKKPPPVTKKA